MVDGKNPAGSMADRIRRKIAEMKPSIQEQVDEIKAKYHSKKCPACNTDYPKTNLMICPRDGTMLLSPVRAHWTWFEYVKNLDTAARRCPKCDGIFSDAYQRCDVDDIGLEAIDVASMKGPLLEERFQLLAYLSSDKLFDRYMAKDLNDNNKMVSVNFLTAAVSQDPKTVSHFLRLGKSIIGLTHPNLESVHSLNVTADGPQNGFRASDYAVPYSVSDYIIANSLDAEIKVRHWFDPSSAATIFIDVLSALSYAHERGITHGAINTSNIRVSAGAENREKGIISNFGAAERLFREMEWDAPSTDTRTANVYGDPDGMCPEFCRGERQTAISDQYQIGCALYEALCGRPPFERPSSTQVLLAHMTDEPDDLATKNSQVPADLIKVVSKCLQKKPADRYPSAQALADELRQFTKP